MELRLLLASHFKCMLLLKELDTPFPFCFWLHDAGGVCVHPQGPRSLLESKLLCLHETQSWCWEERVASFYRSSASFCQVRDCEVLLEPSFEGCWRFIFIYSLLSVSSGHKGRRKVTGCKVLFSLRAGSAVEASRAGADVSQTPITGWLWSQPRTVGVW